jgi:hypothetical protein
LNVNSENETFKKKTKFQKSNRSECFDWDAKYEV